MSDPVSAEGSEIAIIGIGCRFPGARGPEEYWRNLRDGVESISFFSEAELASSGVHPAAARDPSYVPAAGVLDRIEQFDASFFGFTRREAELTDPQHRLFLECAWEALESACCVPDSFDGSIGVFAGSSFSSYLVSNIQPDLSYVRLLQWTQALVANDKDYLSTHVSYKLNLRGPSVGVQTACSTSLVAVHLACQSLLNRECDVALAGGVTVRVPHLAGYVYEPDGIGSSDGRCRPFDASARGTVFGSGVGVVALKRLSDALADGDCIRAVIRGSAINNDGSVKVGFTAPSVEGQTQVIAEAQAIAGVAPETIDYIEAHGTGTPLGDPIEIAALAKVFGEARGAKRGCLIGSVKGNFGHLEVAAGVAGLIKTVLALEHRALPPSLHFVEPNPRCELSKGPFNINTKLTEWKRTRTPRRAGVSSFGMGGTNAHVVLEEAPARPEVRAAAERPAQLLCLSAKREEALRALAGQYAEHLASHPEERVSDVCFTARAGRAHFAHRLSVIGASREEMQERLSALARGEPAEQTEQGRVERPDGPRVAFLFTGQGSQYVGMGRELFATEPVFRRALEECDALLRRHLERPLIEVLYPSEGQASPLDETEYTQPALFAVEYALSAQWKAWGIEPIAVLGHSVGEYVAACVAGVFGLEQGLELIATRGRLMQGLPKQGAMAALFADEATVAEAVRPYAAEVSVAAVNGPLETVVSGARGAVTAVVEALEARGVKSRWLNVSHAFHSPLMGPMVEAFERAASKVKLGLPQRKLIANVTGRAAREELAQASYWSRHVRAPVRFMEGVRALQEAGAEAFVEVGPAPVLSAMGRRCVPEGAGVWLPSLRPKRSDCAQMLESLGALYVRGAKVDFAGLDRDRARRKLVLPTYPFQRERCWIDPPPRSQPARPVQSEDPAGGHPLLGQRLRSPAIRGVVFEARLSSRALPFLNDHQVFDVVVFPATAYLELAFAAGAAVLGPAARVLEQVVIHEALPLPAGEERALQIVLVPGGAGEASFEIFSARAEPFGGEVDWRLHASGAIRSEDPRDVRAAPPLDAIRARHAGEMTGESYYRQASALGVHYGDAFRGLSALWRQDGEVVAEICAPAALAEDEGRYCFHPALLDACLHIVGGALLGADGSMRTSSPYLPVAFDRVRLHGRPGNRLWSHVTLRPSAGEHGAALHGEMRVLTPEGGLLLEAEGLSLHKASPEALRIATGTRLESWLYKVEWQPRRRAVSEWAPDAAAGGRWWIFADGRGVGAALAEALRRRGERCLVVPSPAEPPRAGEVARFEEVVRALEQDTADRPLRGVVHLWGLDAPSAGELTATSLAAAEERCCGSILRVTQTLGRANLSTRVWLVTRGTQPVEPGAQIELAATPTWGLGRTIALEHPEVWGGMIDLDPAYDAERAAAMLLGEMDRPDGEDHVALRDGQRYVQRVVAGGALDLSAQVAPLRPDRTYLVTGGMGGLGRRVARRLVERGARHLALMGRREPTAEAAEELRRIRESGAEIAIFIADVSIEEDAARVLNAIAREMPPLAGVVHAAGLPGDSVLLRHTWEQFAAVLAAKVQGSWNLHVLTRDLPLDFCVYFSSLAAIAGAPSQSSYAAANAFLDALAHHRRALGLPALSVDWGPFSEVGMLATRGASVLSDADLVRIPPDLGARILDQLIERGGVQTSVVSGDLVSHIHGLAAGRPVPIFSSLPQVARERRAAGEASAGASLTLQAQIERAPSSERRDLVFRHVHELAARVLGVRPVELVDPLRGFFEMGMDSLSSILLKNQLQAGLGRPLPSTVTLDYPSVNALSRFVCDDVLCLERGEPAPSAASAVSEDEKLLAEIKQLSRSELEAQLAELTSFDEENVLG
ncbi:type I polyketide synthase [Sorangium atrum]|uniref:Type I polyketide synthase n=1 Tax=Sorangium atrum TaxID=2995308 RepID=A0ABT5BRK4_9BACT|nr:type I polyketide synthase [Sorangium aterium]MDC0676180.1 type I polyketide synthase [Sorangium aterium]